MSKSINAAEFQSILNHQLSAMKTGDRQIIAIAGAPASGKSTLAKNLVKNLNLNHPNSTALLPMDGYHLDDGILSSRNILARKGAPFTFDVAGLCHALQRLKDNTEEQIYLPNFDRSLEISRAGAISIPQNVQLIIAEGNYLLLNEPPWNSTTNLFDKTALISVDEDTLAARLKQRWIDYNLNPDQIRDKLELNDLPNGRYIYKNSITPDFLIK